MSDFPARSLQIIWSRSAGETACEALLELCRREIFARLANEEHTAGTAGDHGDDVEDDQNDGECAAHNI